MTSHEFANELKFLADEMLACSEFEVGDPTIYGVTIDALADKSAVLDFAKNLRPCKKEYSNDEIKLIFGSGLIKATTRALRNSVCTLVTPAQPAVYECEPLLSQAEEVLIEEGR